MLRYYHYRRLSTSGQKAYKAIVAALRRFAAAAVVDRVENLQVVVDAVKNDNPHLFYVNWQSVIYRSEFCGVKILVCFTYREKRTDAIHYLEEAKRRALPMRGKNDRETVRNVHDYLATLTKYDRETVQSGRYRVNDHNMLGPLFEGLAVCEGIARATQFLLRELGVECTYIDGRVRGVSGLHAWNLVKLDGKILKLDVTWDLADGGRVSYNYFCVTPDATDSG